MLPLLLTTALLAQSPALAAATPTPASLTPVEVPAAPTPLAVSTRDESQSIRLLRIPLETLAGVVTGVGVGLVGAAIGCGIGGHCSGGGEEIPPAAAYFIVTAPLGLPIGTWLVGDALDGDGSLLAAYGGLAAAGALTGGMALAMGNHFDDTALPADLGLVAFLLGPAIGYELSSHAHKLAKVNVVPLLTRNASGLSLVAQF